MVPDVEIVGAGIAGLSSAIFCARAGLDVVVHEKAARVGGWLPRAIHCTSYIDLEKLERTLGIDLKHHFRPARVEVWFENSKCAIPDGKLKMYNVERGSGRTSFDTYLGKIARKEGVAIRTASPITAVSQLRAKKSIIATGWHKGLLQACKVRTTDGDGVLASTSRKSGPDACIAIIDRRITDWYTHVGITRDFTYFIVGSNRRLGDEQIRIAQEVLLQEKLIPHKLPVSVFRGAQVTAPRLFLDPDRIFAGACSGSTSPLSFHGLAEAIVSGRIASLAISEPVRAQRAFDSVFRNRFYLNALLSRFRAFPIHDRIAEAVVRTIGLMPWLSFDYPDL